MTQRMINRQGFDRQQSWNVRRQNIKFVSAWKDCRKPQETSVW